MGGFLDYIPGNSLLHKLTPLTKLIASFLMCISCFISDSHFYVLGMIIVTLLLAASAGVAQRSIGILRKLLKFSLFLFVVQIFFVRDGNILLQLPFHIYITDKGLLFSLLFVLRLLAATMPLSLMLSVTQMNDLSNVLVDKVGIPYKYAFALTTSIRFIPIFTKEMSGIMEAQTARGVEFDTKNFFKKIKLILPLCVPLLISSVKKVDSGAVSAELRGFNLRGKHSGYKEYRFSGMDVMASGVMMCLVVGAVLL